MASINDLTVTVHLDIDLNGEPVTQVMSMPATYEGMTKQQPGMTVHLHLDGAQLAKALLPELMKLMHQQTRTDAVIRRTTR